MRRRIAIILLLIGSAGAMYALWALYRVSDECMMAEAANWPRAFPYPDHWLSDLNDYYDAKYPPSRGTVKIHAELPRVRATLAYGGAFFGVIASCGATPLLVSAWKSRLRSSHGFDVVR